MARKNKTVKKMENPAPTEENVEQNEENRAHTEENVPQKRGRKSPPANETPKERFIRLASQRLIKAQKALGRLANCSNQSVYLYSEAQVTKIFRAIDSSVDALKMKFTHKRVTEVSLSE